MEALKKIVLGAGLAVFIAANANISYAGGAKLTDLNGAASQITTAENINPETEQNSYEKYIETSHYNIIYNKDIDLAKVKRRINICFLADKPEPKKASLEHKIMYKFDSIYDRTQEILDVNPPNCKVNVTIFKNADELNNKYKEIFNEENNAPAFYCHNFKMIYLNQERINEHIIAHETAHAILDSYFGAANKALRIKEILAQYVDLRLEEK